MLTSNTGLYISDLPSWGGEFKDKLMITILGQVVPADALSVNKESQFVLEVDVGKAWTVLKLKAGYSNEAEVKLSILP